MKIPVLLLLFLLPAISGCGHSDSQPVSAPPVNGATDVKSPSCSSIENSGLVKQCAVNSRDYTVHVMIDSEDDQAGRDACDDVSKKISGPGVSLRGKWTLQVYSPYRNDKPLATCPLD